MANTPLLGTSGVRDVGVSELDLGALRQNINQIIIALNSKDSAFYQLTEVLNGQSWFPNPALTSSTAKAPTIRQAHRKVINFSTLPNTAAKTVAHGIPFTATSGHIFTRMYGTATDPVNALALPIPFASPTDANEISLSIDATNVIITTGSNRTAYTQCVVVIEWIFN